MTDTTSLPLVRSGLPCVIVHDGEQATQYTDTYAGDTTWLKPIQRAVTVARLRTLADLIEGAHSEGS